MADPKSTRGEGAPPSHIHIEKKPINWLAWIALIAGILALLFWLTRRHDDDVATMPQPVPTASSSVLAETPNAPTATALGTSALSGYLAGTDPAPRTFTFEKLNFETAKSDIRPADEADVDAVAATLKQYSSAHIRIAGYADTRGNEAANVALGKARAESVKAALVAKGIDGARIETATGGDKDPVDTNATATGRAENRRTELVVTQR